MTILQFLAIPWLFSVIFLYLTVVEIKNDNPRDAKLLGVICALAFLCAIFLTGMVITGDVGLHEQMEFQIT